ncbi:MAG: ATP-dependent DNA helicase [Ilumatobacter sp.]|uniref:ATP-dependent DNA helicase n=1 Tax=Ilumatobacter sp. TaxID=1967498 RepID=UPI00261A4E0B|nr:ATP-dependent DNA helicase [Ilumatobacter sp.]MDJ0771661.1 ATP-dependent DNA helicase [Ilumatobacter sp.]
MTEPSAASAAAVAALDAVTAALPAAEVRDGQREMTERVASAIDEGRHLVVQAGTGTGKTLAYLVPAIAAGKRTIVATATKALQDQLATKDLPFLAEHLAEHDVDFDWAVLKGRSNYVCLQRLREMAQPDQGQLELEEMSAITKLEIKKIAEWVGESATGDQAELEWNPSDTTWRAVSVGSDECPGADRCPMGQECFAELARRRAQASDVVVVNTYLYGLHVGSGGAILPEHDVVVFDEAHGLEDIMSDTVGVEIAPGRFVTVGATIRRFLDDPELVGSITELASALRDVLGEHTGQRLDVPLPPDITDVLEDAQLRLTRVGEAVQQIETSIEDAQQRKLRAQRMITRSMESVTAALTAGDATVPFVSGRPESPRLEIAPLDVGPTLAAGVWAEHTAVLTSATIPSSLGHRVGLPDGEYTEIDVGSPFDYESQALLYCAMHLPQPRSPKFRADVADELIALIQAAGGRTLALFTSWAAMDAAVDAVRDEVDVPILTQRDLPKPALVKQFSESEETCLFATTGLFQGVDVPGRTLSLVVIDKLPFPRPDDPLLSARREQLGPAAFGEIDIPRAATLLAQAAGRLIRSTSDRGVVAVLDPRLGTARYRWDIVNALPPMKRTRERKDVEAFLRELHG